MPLYRVQVASAHESLMARDAIVNTFHLNREGIPGFDDPDAIASDVCDAWGELYGVTRIETRIYEARGAAPHFPVGQHVKNPNDVKQGGMPREVALCLSYYGERNLPRTRGRMFICAALAGLAASTRPSPGNQDVVLAHANRIAALGGLDVDWQVYSPTSDAAENVQHAYVDDEWDTIRSRGLRPTQRHSAAISE
jgi:hypothetical protein